MEADSQVITIDGWPLTVRRKGRGDPVLVLHGEDEGPEWLDWMDRLAGTHEVILPEHPGFGEADAPGWITEIEDLAYLYLDLIHAVGLGRVHLVGHSLGGWIAAEMAVRSCDRLASLTLVGAAGIHVPGVGQVDAFLGDEREQMRALVFDPEHGDALARRRLDPAQEDLYLRQRLTTARLMWQPRGYNPQLAKWLHRVRVPSLLVWGDTDRFYPPEYAQAFAERLPQSTTRILPRCGHLPQLEAPALLAAAVAEFIGSHG